MERRFDTFIFDLDGTLLDTLPDLVSLTNRALRDAGFPERTEEEILSAGASCIPNAASNSPSRTKAWSRCCPN